MRLSFQFTYGIFADDFESFVPYIKPELLEEAKKVFAEDSDLTFKYFNNSSIEAFKDCLRLLRYTDEEQLFDMADAFTFMVVIDSPCVDDEEYYEAYMDIAWGLDYAVCEPCDGYYNSPFCKEDFKKRNLPVIVAKKMEKYEFIDNFINCLARADYKIFLGDSAVSLSEKGHMVDFFHKSITHD